MEKILSRKQMDSYLESTARLNLWEGSVRSGKSYISIQRFAKELRDGPKGAAMLIGATRESIQRNILVPLCEYLHFPIPTPKTTQMSCFGRIVYFVGANDERAQKKIQGSTLAMAYVDELSLIPYGFVKMLQSRLSIADAKLFATTNPDSPFHWLKTEYIDNPNLDLKKWSFRIEDNPSLTQKYIDSLKAEYSGLWYKRYIEGLWVLAEGTVYDFFDEELHVIPHSSKRADYYIVGIDYGTTNPTTFMMVGYNPSAYPNIWLEREYYFDSKKAGRQKTDTEYAEDLQKFIQGYNVQAIYLDPSAASFRAELYRQGIDDLFEANNDVIDGIRFVSMLLSNGTLKICAKCKNVIKEFSTYIWDVKASEKGEDRPVKAHDHCFPSGTKIITETGIRPIEEINKGERVLTRTGMKEVLNTFQSESSTIEVDILGKNIEVTPNHLFRTLEGWKKAQDLIQSDTFFINVEENPCNLSFNSMEYDIESILNPKTIVTECITELEKLIASKGTDIYIETYTNSIMEKFHPDTIFITLMGIPKTMTLATLNLSNVMSILPIMQIVLQKSKDKLEESMLKESDHLQKNGMQATQEENGTKSTLKKLMQRENQSFISAKSAKQNSNLPNCITRDFVRISVKVDGEEKGALIMSPENANTVITNLQSINTVNPNTALSLVVRKNIGKKKVYNLHVEENHEYYVENVLVHNCLDALRYALFTHFGEEIDSTSKPEDIDKIFYEATQRQRIPNVFMQPQEQMNHGRYY